MAVRRGDDTNAFDFGFLTVNLADAENYTITKAEIRIGTIIKTIKNPIFPIRIALNRQETMLLSEVNNKCYMAIYDYKDRKYTCEGSICFPAKPKVV